MNIPLWKHAVVVFVSTLLGIIGYIGMRYMLAGNVSSVWEIILSVLFCFTLVAFVQNHINKEWLHL